MNKKDRLKPLLEKLNSLDKKKQSSLSEELANLTSKLKDNFAVKTLKSVEKIGNEVEKFKTDFNLKPILDAVKSLGNEINRAEEDLRLEFESRIAGLPKTPDLTNEVINLRTEFENRFNLISNDELKKDIDNLSLQLQTFIENDSEEDKQEKLDFTNTLNKLRTDLNSRISSIGGGSMNRQIFIGGSDPLTRYTDLNIKAGTNVTITYANNNSTKKVDVTFAASGGGGGTGIVRSINSVSISTAAATASGTDYVYLCTGTLTITLPDATTNTNLYTIKNVGSGVVTIATTSAQTIDGNATIQMGTRFTSVDLISDTSNWNIT